MTHGFDNTHKYGVGVPIEGGEIMVLYSCSSEEELEEKFRKAYKFAFSGGLTRPLPVEKVDKQWERTKLCICDGLVKKIKKEFKDE